MLLPEDDFPIHQTPLPLAHAMGGHPNAYDRFWFNGVGEDLYFALALGIYPNRGVIDAAFSVLENGTQRSVFASDLLRGRETSVGPISVEIIEPLRVNRIRVHAPDQGLECELTYAQRTATIEEPRQTMFDGARTFMDVTRATQLGTWEGWIDTPNGRRDISGMMGTKDRSWGVRPVGEALPGAPGSRLPQLCFFWTPIMLEDHAIHVMNFNDSEGLALHHSAGILPLEDEATHTEGELLFDWQQGTRWMSRGQLITRNAEYSLTPIARFHMRGAGYSHPVYGHGKYHGGAVVDGEELLVNDLDPLDYHNIHVQHVVKVEGPQSGIGVVEQLIIGPYEPAGLTGLLDGAS